METGCPSLGLDTDKDILVSTHLGSHAHVPINQSEKEIVGLFAMLIGQQTALLMIVVRILSEVHVMRALLVPGQCQKLPFFILINLSAFVIFI
jgi:hypothetical protein